LNCFGVVEDTDKEEEDTYEEEGSGAARGQLE
jgi:hypothetical protein